jgi:hypothetical protein
MRYTQLLPIAGAATALANPIVPRKECADESYDFVSAGLENRSLKMTTSNTLRLLSVAEQLVWLWRLALVLSFPVSASW